MISARFTNSPLVGWSKGRLKRPLWWESSFASDRLGVQRSQWWVLDLLGFTMSYPYPIQQMLAGKNLFFPYQPTVFFSRKLMGFPWLSRRRYLRFPALPSRPPCYFYSTLTGSFPLPFWEMPWRIQHFFIEDFPIEISIGISCNIHLCIEDV